MYFSTKYITKLSKIENTCRVFNYVFKYLYFDYLTSLLANTQNNLGFSRAVTSGSCTVAKYTKLCMFSHSYSRNML